ncbi:MAG: hypothetical protein OXB97_00445 [Rhodospirillales bacterium]|nr:hypothetical protein [Rhodospirillales bacterium]
MSKPSVETIVSYVARFHDLTVEHLAGRGRSRRVAEVRHTAMYLCCLLRDDLSAGVIGRLFAHDASTVRQAWRETEKRAADNPWFAAHVDALRRGIVAAGPPQRR